MHRAITTTSPLSSMQLLGSRNSWVPEAEKATAVADYEREIAVPNAAIKSVGSGVMIIEGVER